MFVCLFVYEEAIFYTFMTNTQNLIILYPDASFSVDTFSISIVFLTPPLISNMPLAKNRHKVLQYTPVLYASFRMILQGITILESITMTEGPLQVYIANYTSYQNTQVFFF